MSRFRPTVPFVGVIATAREAPLELKVRNCGRGKKVKELVSLALPPPPLSFAEFEFRKGFSPLHVCFVHGQPREMRPWRRGVATGLSRGIKSEDESALEVTNFLVFHRNVP